jgi:hypothetical protein
MAEEKNLRWKLYYGNPEKQVGTSYSEDPLAAWNGEDKVLEVDDSKGNHHTLNIGPGVSVRSSSYHPGSGKVIVS